MTTPEEQEFIDAEKEAFLSDGGEVKRYSEQTGRVWNYDLYWQRLEQFSVGDPTKNRIPTVDPYFLERPPSFEEPAE